jgi:putative membrane protein
MIRSYSDHSANERTFLAWLRTAVAVVAFGVVIEKLNLFVLAIASGSSVDAASRERLGRYDGLALILVGIVLIVVAAARFIRIERLIDDRDEHTVGSARTELIVSAVLVLIVAGFSIYLAVS